MPKTCNVCRVSKDETEFNKRVASPDGLGHTCRPCAAERNRKWREKNPDGFRQWLAKNADRRKDASDKWAEKNKEKIAANYARWVDENRAHVYARNMARLAAKLRATPSWADLEKIKSIHERAVELTKQTGVRHEVDHYYPLRGDLVSGLHCHENLQILTRSENARKKNHMPMEAQ